MNYRGLWIGQPGMANSDRGMSHAMIVEKMRHFMKVARGYLEFLRNDSEKEERGMARAFLFENLLKSLILIVDDMLT